MLVGGSRLLTTCLPPAYLHLPGRSPSHRAYAWAHREHPLCSPPLLAQFTPRHGLPPPDHPSWQRCPTPTTAGVYGAMGAQRLPQRQAARATHWPLVWVCGCLYARPEYSGPSPRVPSWPPAARPPRPLPGPSRPATVALGARPPPRTGSAETPRQETRGGRGLAQAAGQRGARSGRPPAKGCFVSRHPQSAPGRPVLRESSWSTGFPGRGAAGLGTRTRQTGCGRAALLRPPSHPGSNSRPGDVLLLR